MNLKPEFLKNKNLNFPNFKSIKVNNFKQEGFS